LEYFAQFVVGTLGALLGIMFGYAKYESPTRSTSALITAAVIDRDCHFLGSRQGQSSGIDGYGNIQTETLPASGAA